MLPELGDLSLLLIAAFLAGLFDAAVGGGGMIQIPALFSILPGVPPATLLATNKLASIFGTGSAALHFYAKLNLDRRFLKIGVLLATVGACLGASLVAYLPTDWVRPIVLALLLLMLIKTWRNRGTGVQQTGENMVVLALIGTATIGFYDGFFGPGTGSFLIFVFVRWLGQDFLHASAHAKVINTGTNFGALLYFAWAGHVWWALGFAMAVANIAGAQAGAHIAIKGGPTLVRRLFLLLCLALTVRLAWTMLSAG